MADGRTVCVTGATGYIGSWLVMRLLERGYNVRATVRDPKNTKKVKHLLDLPNANTNLTLWKADLVDEGSFDEPIRGCVGVFHVASPVLAYSTDPETDLIKPAINGVLNVMKSCMKAGTVKRVVYTSSVGAVCMQAETKLEFDEDDWSDVDFLRAIQCPCWMYFVSKTLAEKTAQEFAENNDIEFVSVIPALVNGPFLTSTLPESIEVAMCLITRNTSYYSLIPNPCFLVHINDTCMAHIYLFEHPGAKGRYLCTSHELTLSDLSKNLKDRYSDFDIVTEFEGIEFANHLIKFSRKKLTELGFEFKCSVEDMYDGAIQSYVEKGIQIVASKVDHQH